MTVDNLPSSHRDDNRVVPDDRPRVIMPPGASRHLSETDARDLRMIVAAGPNGYRTETGREQLAAQRLERAGLVERRGPISDPDHPSTARATYLATLAGQQSLRRCVMAQDLRRGDVLAGHRVTMVTDYGTHVAVNLEPAEIRYLDYGWPTFPDHIADHGANLRF